MEEQNDINQNEGEMNDMSETSGSSGSSSSRSFRDTMKSGSADEVRQKAKDVVQKGVAAVAGALKGFTEETEKSRIADTSKGAVKSAGETIRHTASAVTEEAHNLKEPLKEAGQKLSETARELGSTAREQVKGTRDAFKKEGGGSSEFGGSSLGLGKGALDTSADDDNARLGGDSSYGGTSGNSLYGGSSGSSTTGTEMPDISKTPLAKPDSELKGKDLTSDLDE